MLALTWCIEILFLLASFFIMLYSISQLMLSWFYFKSLLNDKVIAPSHTELKEFPFVTIQLPVYNEKYVIERLIECVAGLNYPKDRFEIQVLDDSDDETSEIAARKIEALKNNDIPINLIQRRDRTGYKAGALQFGTSMAKGDFIAIFDADFLPDPDFLKHTLVEFSDLTIAFFYGDKYVFLLI